MKNKIAAIILARSGSVGLKNKNTLNLGGAPLIAHTIKLLKRVKKIDKIFVSTDSNKIAKISKKYGAEVPFLRPKNLSKNSSTSEEALCYTVRNIRKKKIFNPSLIVYSQITEPFKTSKIISKAIDILQKKKLDSVFTAKPYKKNIWYKKKGKYLRLNDFEKYGLPRQKKFKLFREDTGVVCVSKTEVILSKKRIGKNIEILPYENAFDYIDIHSKEDLILANLILKKKLFTFE
mgnify:FL=1